MLRVFARRLHHCHGRATFSALRMNRGAIMATAGWSRARNVPCAQHVARRALSTDDLPQAKGMAVAGPLERLILRSKLTQDADLARIIARAGSATLYGFATLTVLGTLGVDTTPLVAGVGITGFTVGFALKEIATNFLSGLMLVFSKPFVRGQTVRVMGGPGGPYEGRVESIDPRYVLLRTKDNAVAMIPSAIVYSSALVVVPKETERQS